MNYKEPFHYTHVQLEESSFTREIFQTCAHTFKMPLEQTFAKIQLTLIQLQV